MRLPKLNRWDGVRVEWSDPQAIPAEWNKLKLKDCRTAGCITIGQVWTNLEDRLVVLLTWDSVNKHVNGGIVIPHVNISKIQVIWRPT